MKCLSEQEILEVQLGDAAAPEREHVQGCTACATRARALARDLGRLDAVLGEAPPPACVRARRVQWAPLAAAAVLVLAVAVQRYTTAARPAVDDTEVLALLDELSGTFETVTSDGVERSATTPVDPSSTCTWGDPLSGLGCDEPGITVLAWR